MQGLSTLARFGGHQLVELRVLGELIGKRNKAGADLDQSVTGIYIGDIGKLSVRDVQQLRKLQSVCGCLIEHNNEPVSYTHLAFIRQLDNLITLHQR